VGRMQRAMTSLVAAIPAAFLLYLLVMVFVTKADALKISMQIIAGVTLLLSAGIAAMPFFLLIPGRGEKSKEAAKNAAKAGAAAAVAGGSDTNIESGVEEANILDSAVDIVDAEDAESAIESEELAATSDFIMPSEEPGTEETSAFEMPADEDVSMDDFDSLDNDFETVEIDDDEAPPKKGKRK